MGLDRGGKAPFQSPASSVITVRDLLFVAVIDIFSFPPQPTGGPHNNIQMGMDPGGKAPFQSPASSVITICIRSVIRRSR